MQYVKKNLVIILYNYNANTNTVFKNSHTLGKERQKKINQNVKSSHL